MATGGQSQPQELERNELMDGGATDIGMRAKSVSWYNPELTMIPDLAREILEEYSRVAREQIEGNPSIPLHWPIPFSRCGRPANGRLSGGAEET